MKQTWEKKENVNTRNNASKNNSRIATRIVSREKKKVRKIEGPDLERLEYDIRRDIRRNYRSFKKIKLLIIIFAFIIILFIALHCITPKIVLNGSRIVEIPYGGTYKEEGAIAKHLGKKLEKNIKINHSIDTSKVGDYEVTYILKYSFYQVKKKRIVKVVDKKKPVIVLEGEQDINICPNSEFKEIGYQAMDEYDGDLTSKVKIKKKKEEVIYSVKDSSGNMYSITRKINKIDNQKPEITLKGNSTMYLTPEDTFKEPGYTASDNCSGDITDKVVVSGNVKSGKLGTYLLTYEVEDDSKNKTTVERKVIVSEKTDPNSGVIKPGVIYLTFDDGPSNVTTGDILNVLKEEGVKATFFVTNNGPDYLIKRMYDEGHTVALHTASHNYAKVYQSDDAYFEDLKIVSDRVKRITGQTSKIVRFPGGSSNTISRRYSKGIMSRLSEELFNRGYRYYDWNIDSNDAYNAKTKEAVYQNVVSHLSKNRANVVLMHDIKTTTRDAIRDIIRYGKENGYTFERIDMDTHMVRQKINN